MKEVTQILKKGVVLFFFVFAVTSLLQYYNSYMQAYRELEKSIADSNIEVIDSNPEEGYK